MTWFAKFGCRGSVNFRLRGFYRRLERYPESNVVPPDSAILHFDYISFPRKRKRLLIVIGMPLVTVRLFPGTNACSKREIPCPELCLPTPVGSVCACSDGSVPGPVGKTCLSLTNYTAPSRCGEGMFQCKLRLVKFFIFFHRLLQSNVSSFDNSLSSHSIPREPHKFNLKK